MSKPRIVALPGIVHADGLVERTRHIATFEQKYAVVDMCPKCGGELDTGWECNRCGYDAMPHVVALQNEAL
jgi:tRNA(Ile2) C34 agmatinyltransferase TiaS